MGCGCTSSLVDIILMHTFGNQSTHRQKRQKMSPNRNQNALESTKNLPCDRNVNVYREYNGGELANLHITASYGLSSICWSSKKCELSSFPMRRFISLSFHSYLCFKLTCCKSFHTWFSGSLYIRDEKLQQKCIWLLEITHSPKTLALAPPCSYQKGDILSHTASIQTHCRPLTPNKQPTSPSNIFLLLHRIILYNENSNCYYVRGKCFTYTISLII